MKRIWTIIGMGAMIMAFQNCQKTEVSSANDGLGKLTAVTADDPEDAEGTILQPDAPTDPNASSDDPNVPADPNAPMDPTVPSLPSGPGNSDGKKNRSVDSGNGNVCILEGPGKSVKLGVLSGAPSGQNKIPSVLCMSANACLNIASQAFGVKGPEFRGYCKLPHGNPHVVHISDDQLQQKVNEILNK